MRAAGALLVATMALGIPALAQAETPSAFVAALISTAKAEGVFADASTAAEPRARHIASGVVCRFVMGKPASIQLLPGGREPADNVGCTMSRGTDILALQVQRIPAAVDAAKFLKDMVEVVRVDFPDATPVDPPAGAPALQAARFNAVFEGRPVYVEVGAIHAGPWMVSGHIVALRKDAETADRITREEVQAAAKAIGR